MSNVTFDCSDDTVAIFYQLFEEFACPLQLHFITLKSLSEVGTVQIAVAELQRRMPHLLNHWVSNNRNTGFVKVSHAAYARLSHATHSCSILHTSSVVRGRNHGVRGSLRQPLLAYEARRAVMRCGFDSLPSRPCLTRCKLKFN